MSHTTQTHLRGQTWDFIFFSQTILLMSTTAYRSISQFPLSVDHSTASSIGSGSVSSHLQWDCQRKLLNVQVAKKFSNNNFLVNTNHSSNCCRMFNSLIYLACSTDRFYRNSMHNRYVYIVSKVIYQALTNESRKEISRILILRKRAFH